MKAEAQLTPRRPAPTDHEIHHLLRDRWSPHAFLDAPVPPGTLVRLLEAARWAPSSYNEQPWRFIVGDRHRDPDTYDALFHVLNDGNRVWAEQAPILLLSAAKRAFDFDGRENQHAWHDVGLAVAQLTVQATAEGLGVHQMAGLDPHAARETFGIPEAFDPVTAIAVGYPALPNGLPDELAERERAARSRLPLDETAYRRWEEPARLSP